MERVGEDVRHTGVAPALIEAALDAVITVDSTGCIVQFNSAAEAMFGCTREEAVGKGVADLIVPPDPRTAQRAGVDRLAAGGPAWILDRRVQQQALRRGGEEFPVELTVTKTSQSPLLFTAFIRDLASLRRAQDEAHRRARQLAEAEELVHMGTWERELGTGRTLWSDELYRIHGFQPGDVEPNVDLIIELAHPEDREYVSRVISQIVLEPERIVGKDITLEYRAVRRDGSVREIRARGRVEPDEYGEPARWIGSVLDLTELRLPERELQAHAAVGDALRDLAFAESMVGLLRRLGTALDFCLGSVWTFDPDRDGLSCRASWSASGVDADEFEAAIGAITLRPGQGVAGRAWQSGGPVFSEDVTADPDFASRELAAKLGLQSGLGFAAVTDEQPVAALGYYSFDRRVPSQRLIRTLSGIGRELGPFFSQQRSEIEPFRLTERELEVLRLAAQGNTGPEIAKQLVVSPSTVKSHFENIYDKLGVSDRAAAVAHALRIGLIS